jgi:hypothetical protein
MSFSNLIGTIHSRDGYWTRVNDNSLVIVGEDPSSETTSEYFLPGLHVVAHDDYANTFDVIPLPPSFIDSNRRSIIIPDSIRESHVTLSEYAPNLLMNVNINIGDDGGYILYHKSIQHLYDEHGNVWDEFVTHVVQTIDDHGNVHISFDGDEPLYLGSLGEKFERIKRDMTHRCYRAFKGFSDVTIN